MDVRTCWLGAPPSSWPVFHSQGRMPQLWSTVFTYWHVLWMPGMTWGAHTHLNHVPKPSSPVLSETQPR